MQSLGYTDGGTVWHCPRCGTVRHHDQFVDAPPRVYVPSLVEANADLRSLRVNGEFSARVVADACDRVARHHDSSLHEAAGLKLRSLMREVEVLHASCEEHVRRRNENGEFLMRVAARGGDWSYPCLLANIADHLGMEVRELETRLAADGDNPTPAPGDV
jgi:hypothetical protein